MRFQLWRRTPRARFVICTVSSAVEELLTASIACCGAHRCTGLSCHSVVLFASPQPVKGTVCRDSSCNAPVAPYRCVRALCVWRCGCLRQYLNRGNLCTPLVGRCYIQLGVLFGPPVCMPCAGTRTRGQACTVGLGCLIFFDDYSSILIVGNSLRDVVKAVGVRPTTAITRC